MHLTPSRLIAVGFLLVILAGVCGLAISSCIRYLNRGKGAAK